MFERKQRDLGQKEGAQEGGNLSEEGVLSVFAGCGVEVRGEVEGRERITEAATL